MKPISEVNFLDSECVEKPYPFYAYQRENSPIYEVPGTGVFLVSKGELIEQALKRQEDFSANLTGVLVTGPNGEPEVFDLSSFGATVDAIANADEPSHAIHRKLILPFVTPKIIRNFESTLREWAVELMQPLLDAGRGDWVDQVANPLPTRAMAAIVGLPLEDADRLLDWAMTGTQILAGVTTMEKMGPILEKTAEMSNYLSERLQLALAAPAGNSAPGIIGELARAVHDNVISEHDGVSILIVLAGAGGESTSSLIGSAVRILAERPELQSQLRADPSLIPTFVEETVRLEPSFRGHYRAVKRNTTLGGVELPAGSRLFLLWAAANRDPKVYDHPDEIDLSRRCPQNHLSFGKGIHFCVGARLARLEPKVVLEELLANTRAFELDPQQPAKYVHSAFVRRHSQLGLILHT